MELKLAMNPRTRLDGAGGERKWYEDVDSDVAFEAEPRDTRESGLSVNVATLKER